VPANSYGQYLDLDLVAGFCLLGFCGSTVGSAERGSRFLANVLPLALGFLATREVATFFGVAFLVVRVLPFDCTFFKDSNVPFMPA